MARGRSLTSRLLGRPAPAPPAVPWVDPRGLDLRVEWAAPGEPDRTLLAEVSALREKALPNSWLPFCRRIVIVPCGTVGGDDPFDPETVTLELEEAGGRIAADSWLALGRHCASLAPMPCAVEEWQHALEADRRSYRRLGLRRSLSAIMRLRDLGIDPQSLKGDDRVGERLNEIVNGGMDPAKLSPERDFLGDSMVMVAERAGYPIIDLREGRVRTVSDHGGCRIWRPSANEQAMLQMVCLVMGGEVERDRALAYLEHANPNRTAILNRAWPSAQRVAPHPF